MTANAGPLAAAVAARLRRLTAAQVVRRIWRRDPTVWVGDPATPEVADRLGWLMAPEWTADRVDDLVGFSVEVRGEFDHVVLLGMGGSSLAPEVLWRTWGRQDGYPTFAMLDSTHPAAVQAVAAAAPSGRTLFVVSSKSGTTIETVSLYQYFWSRVAGRGAQFVAITDSGTPLERLAVERGFRRVFTNPADIGGRYSALSLFGMAPAALIGVDVRRLVDRGAAMARACAIEALEENPGARLGVLLGEAVLAGRDKLTLLADPDVASFGLWVEQLVAESTGKDGTGIVPVAEGMTPGPPGYASDRVFVGTTLVGRTGCETDSALRGLEEDSHPVTRLAMDDCYALGAEFFRWEFATALAGAILRINPFDQPNVAESKRNTERMLRGGHAGAEIALATTTALRSFVDGVRPGDYLAILAYVPPSKDHDRRLASLRAGVQARLPAAVTAAYGPRYLHSTGQLHKGGPASGHFVQVIPRVDADLAVPGADYTFGQLLTAQADGDYEALRARGRPVVRVAQLEVLEAALA